jgi:adenylylsulfate reductase subunit B
MRSSDAIMWAVRFRNKSIKRFKFPIRTTPEGSIEPDAGYSSGTEDLKSPLLRTEPESIGTELFKK